MSGESRKQATIWVMLAVLRHKLRDCRAVIAFEDVHWMDSSSWALLKTLAADVKPLLVCLSLRPIPPSARVESYEALAKAAGDEGVLELKGLQGADLEALLCDALRVGSVPPKLVE
eukprot:6715690-Prymnesium_polylepis.2